MRSSRILVAATSCATIPLASAPAPIPQKWQETFVSIDAGRRTLAIREKKKPPPFGCVLWPAGRVLLEYALIELRPGSVVLEIGSGCGLTAIGLVSARPSIKVIATDSCRETLQNLEHNVSKACVADRVAILQCNAATLEQPFPFDVHAVTDVIAVDVIYGTGADDGLARSFANLLAVNQNIRVHVILQERCDSRSEEGLSFDSNVTAFDSALRKEGAASGLTIYCVGLPDSVAQAMCRQNYWWSPIAWLAPLYFGSFRLYRISKTSSPH